MLDRLNGMFAFAIWDSRARPSCSRATASASSRSTTRPPAGRFRLRLRDQGLLVDPAVPRTSERRRACSSSSRTGSPITRPRRCSTASGSCRPGAISRCGRSSRVPHPCGGTRCARRSEARSRSGRGRGSCSTRRSRCDCEATSRSACRSPAAWTRRRCSRSLPRCALPKESRRRSRSRPARAIPTTDEHRYAAQVAAATGSKNAEVLPAFEGLVDELDSIVWHMDEPFHSPSVYGQRKVDELARNAGVIVLLDGQGGDEVLSGYHHFHYPPLLLALLRRGRIVRSHARAACTQAPDRHLACCGRRRTSCGSSSRPYRRANGRPDWLAPGVAVTDRPRPSSSLAAHQDYGLQIAPLPAYNHHADRNSMTFSLETRNPFLDVRLVEAARGLRSEDLLHDGFTKWALREAVRDVVPAEVVDRAAQAGLHDRRGDLAARGCPQRRLRARVLVAELREPRLLRPAQAARRAARAPRGRQPGGRALARLRRRALVPALHRSRAPDAARATGCRPFRRPSLRSTSS